MPALLRRAGGVLVAAVSSTVLSACGVGATVHMKDGSSYRGRPVTSDATTMTLRVKKRRLRICKRDVEDVDHAGNAGAIAGGAVFLAGSALLAGALAQPEPRDPITFLVGRMVPFEGG